jgi:hypothetical protein
MLGDGKHIDRSVFNGSSHTVHSGHGGVVILFMLFRKLSMYVLQFSSSNQITKGMEWLIVVYCTYMSFKLGETCTSTQHAPSQNMQLKYNFGRFYHVF